MTAAVHVSDNKRLTVIANLVQKNFGPKFKNIEGGCLAAQFIYSLSSVSGISAPALMKVINDSQLIGGYKGVTLSELFEIFNNKVIKLSDDSKVKFHLSVEKYTLDGAISAVKSGQPVVSIIPASLGYNLDNLSGGGSTGIVKSQYARQWQLKDTTSFHALLLIGYDEDEKTLIFREMRSIYALKGYIKIKRSDISGKTIKFIGTVVDSVERL